MSDNSLSQPAREKNRRRRKRASLNLEERETDNFETPTRERPQGQGIPERIPLHEIGDGEKLPVPGQGSSNSNEGSVGVQQEERRSRPRRHRPRRASQNPREYDEDEDDGHADNAYSPERKRHKYPGSTPRQGRVKRSVSDEILARQEMEEANVNGTMEHPHGQRRKPKYKKAHGSRDPMNEDGAENELTPDQASSGEHPRRHRPRKPKTKKTQQLIRVQNATSAEEDNYNADMDGEVSMVDASFKLDKEDIITGEPAGTNHIPPPATSVVTTLPSQPLDVLFIERKDGHGFRSERKSRLQQLRDLEDHEIPLVGNQQLTTMEFALSVHKSFKAFALFCHGILAGFAVAQCVFVYSLSGHSGGNADFLRYYYSLAQPVQALYYFLFAICVVSVFDRYDMGSPNSGFLQGLLTRPTRIFTITAYLFALIFSVSVAAIDDRISLFAEDSQDLWTRESDGSIDAEGASLLDIWRIINVMRVLGAFLGWVLISVQPVKDYTAKNLYEGEDFMGDTRSGITENRLNGPTTNQH